MPKAMLHFHDHDKHDEKDVDGTTIKSSNVIWLFPIG